VSAYVEELDVVEKVVVEGKVVAGDDIDTGVLLDLPVLQSQTLALLKQLVPRELVAPVGLVGLLELTVRTHAGEPEY
jgi:predicted transcriptional regulator